MKKLLLVALVAATGGYLRADLKGIFEKAKKAIDVEALKEGRLKDVVKTKEIGSLAEAGKEAAGLAGEPKVYKETTTISFEVKNKTKAPVYFAIKSDGKFYTDDNGITVFSADAGKTTQLPVDISKPSAISVWLTKPDSAEATAEMTFNVPEGKTLYLTWDPSMVLRPQTGPGWGLAGKTDTNMSLKNNVKKADVKKA